MKTEQNPYVILRTERGDFMVGIAVFSGGEYAYRFSEMRTLYCTHDVSIQELATMGLPENESASAPVDLRLHRDHIREYANVTPEAEARFRALPTKPYLWGPNDRGSNNA